MKVECDLRSRRSFVEFYYRGGNNSDANGDPRLALVAATRVCSDPEAENRLLGFYGGISSEESKAVQVGLIEFTS